MLGRTCTKSGIKFLWRGIGWVPFCKHPRAVRSRNTRARRLDPRLRGKTTAPLYGVEVLHLQQLASFSLSLLVFWGNVFFFFFFVIWRGSLFLVDVLFLVPVLKSIQ